MYFDHYVVHLSAGKVETISFSSFRFLFMVFRSLSFSRCSAFSLFCTCSTHLLHLSIQLCVILLSLSCVNFSFLYDKSLKIVFFAPLFNYQTAEECFLCCGKTWKRISSSSLELPFVIQSTHTHIVPSSTGFSHSNTFSHFIQNLVSPVRHTTLSTISLFFNCL